MSSNISNNSEDLRLFHYGIKGMKWGVRRKDSDGDGLVDSKKSGEDSKLSLKNPKVRRAAIAGVAVTGLVASAVVASHFSKNSANLDADKIKAGMEKAKDIFEVPTDLIYMSKAHRGSGVTSNGVEQTSFNFISKGKTKDFFDIFDKAGLNDDNPEAFSKKSNGDVAAFFGDLLGRVDAAGRPIPHAVLIPAEKAVGLDSIEDVISKYGPEIENRYQSYLEESRKNST